MSHKNSKIKVGISCGDPNGIGLEALADALSDERSLSSMIVVVFAPRELAEAAFENVAWSEVDDAKSAKPGQINLVTFEADEFEHTPGEASKEAGAVAMRSLEMAVGHLANTAVDVLVTAPINKDTIRQAGFAFPGHTEYLASEAGVEDVLMLLCCDGLRIGMVTGHVALKDVSSNLSAEAIVSKLRLMHDSLVKDFGLPSPRIAVLGLNPHAGDNGMMGDEEKRILAPAIQKAAEEGISAHGPYAADGFFGSGAFRKFDGVLAMYHDQGLAPFKALSFGRGVNFTAGLPVVRTSPDHGTGFDIAGQGQANGDSFREALRLACDVRLNRVEHREIASSPLEITPPKPEYRARR
ncbi:MAG: 4-hydroxythreonine-4-phosphate dehydrogenase PdxA [Flavobacteriales bacterium]